MCKIKETRFTITGRYLADYLTIFRVKKEYLYFDYWTCVVGTSCVSFSRSSFLIPLITFLLYSDIIETRNLYSSSLCSLHPHPQVNFCFAQTTRNKYAIQGVITIGSLWWYDPKLKTFVLVWILWHFIASKILF